MLRVVAVVVGLASSLPAMAGEMTASEARRFVVGVLACVILAVALFALYKERLAGAWRPVYVIT